MHVVLLLRINPAGVRVAEHFANAVIKIKVVTLLRTGQKWPALVFRYKWRGDLNLKQRARTDGLDVSLFAFEVP